MSYDAVCSELAESFIADLTPQEADDCRRVIRELCSQVSPDDAPRQPVLPNQPGLAERSIGPWHFWYRFLNAQTIAITPIYYSPSNPKHPFNPRLL